jgi:uncharacterized SAM-binding protein YcdF (DUF218 family)
VPDSRVSNTVTMSVLGTIPSRARQRAGHDAHPDKIGPAPLRSLWQVRTLRTAGVVAAVSALAFAGGFLSFVTSLAPEEPRTVADTRGIAVVTGGSNRIIDALRLMAESRADRLLISGVNEKTGRDDLLRLSPVRTNRVLCCIDLDYRARNTIGNAIETRRWQRRHGFDSLMLVTSNYHMPRTLLEFRHAMPNVRLVARPVVTENIDVAHWWRDAATFRVVTFEYMKYLAALARTQIESDPETSRLSIITGGRKPVSPKGQEALEPKAGMKSVLTAHQVRFGPSVPPVVQNLSP